MQGWKPRAPYSLFIELRQTLLVQFKQHECLKEEHGKAEHQQSEVSHPEVIQII